MIVFDKVTKIYSDNSKALEKVSFEVGHGEFLSIVGQSGAGKSTLLKLILVEDEPSDGQVLFDKVNVHELPRRELPHLRRRIGCIFQDFRLLPDKTAFENISFAMEAAGRSDAEIEADVPHALDLVGLKQKIWSFPREMSGGEKQRVAIARAIVNQPDLIIADEPTGNLDPLNTFEIVQILKKINDLGTTVILTTHNKGVIDSLKKRVITLENGRITRDDEHGKYVL
ncbi:MAG TPA: cell division ATP-binding protein FtsE [Candidatus Vogelbacteria bacterium]|uniref:Cell division ATP-binding protein FtsE n=1 Tax=Candidatus Vogelbacteria bacterium RIFOXYD1_FULL_51_18 TaxID=1802440 RepID=A0A1G2QJ89_9BACT|nr:MAG: Cell division ATP-binding protein FtsE [Parcubacteria group bacterium GW2011_GWC1_51_35]KKW24293.1 MAG: Cell division ATP-binding protein FtsE [Parcubacteria group bacterium GW2011_GWF2_52_12]KKW26202.1 MAG: Cell division ATP-binding protein FtsE [Parcubacteria group bacterium GW2011_GWF1_52_5]KKW34640.1 MAG: Cell division ATP-binding protein FtsE [Parcubacteria group bacterium GW2011_GWB1_53_43]KKW38192.1 MAG: Cell division ATP-binding protein FtsE [Parcubacteria group bacterium GW2011